MNKKYIYTFLIAFAVSMAAILGMFYALGLFSDVSALNIDVDEKITTTESTQKGSRAEGVSSGDDKEDKVLNVLAFGLNDGLADTIVLFSYNHGTNRLNLLSVPRDTYHEVQGYPDPWQHKINSVYGYREKGGPIGMKNEVSKLLGIPIHYYVEVDFASVVSIVDTLGGYDVYVPYPMRYDDVYAVPQLHINIPEGWNHLNGQETLEYLRFRRNNDGTISEGDVVRTERQRAFINAMIEKAINSRDIFSLISTIVREEYVGTDMPLEEVLKYAALVRKMPMDRVRSFVLEGEHDMIDSLSFWLPDFGKRDALMRMFYSTDPNVKDHTRTEEENGDDEQ